jgi:hypothetical protein
MNSLHGVKTGSVAWLKINKTKIYILFPEPVFVTPDEFTPPRKI